MNYCNWKDLVEKIVRKFPPDLGSLPDGCIFVVGETTKSNHQIPAWVSIGLEVIQKQEEWMILSGLAPAKKYTPFWDIYARDVVGLQKELNKACNWIGGQFCQDKEKPRKIAYNESYHVDFENSRR